MTDERAERIKRIRNRSRSQATANANDGGDDPAADDADGTAPDGAAETSDPETGDAGSSGPDATASEPAADGAARSETGAEAADRTAEQGAPDGADRAGDSVERATEPAGAATQASARAAEPAARARDPPAPAQSRDAESAPYTGGPAAGAEPAARATQPLAPGAESTSRGADTGTQRVQGFDAAAGTEPIVDATALEAETASADGSVLRGAVGAEDGMFTGDTALNHSARSDENTVQVLEFSLNDDRYAIAIDRISAIVEMKEITRFPRGPEAIDGVTDLRGEITAVVDPTALLNVDRSEPSDDQYIVVLNRDDDKQKLGIRVTDVRQAATYHEDRIDESRGTDDNGHEFVNAIIKKPDGDHTSLISWLDINSIIEQIE